MLVWRSFPSTTRRQSSKQGVQAAPLHRPSINRVEFLEPPNCFSSQQTILSAIVFAAIFGGLGFIVMLLLLLAVGFVAYRLSREHTRRLWALLFVLTLFFTLGAE